MVAIGHGIKNYSLKPETLIQYKLRICTFFISIF